MRSTLRSVTSNATPPCHEEATTAPSKCRPTGSSPRRSVTAPAGAGKTFALAATVDAWQSAGVTVHGAALSARAAAELEASTGIASTTLARLVIDLETIRPGDVVIIELCRAGTRLVAPIFDRAAKVNAKLALGGDPRQLPRDRRWRISVRTGRTSAPDRTDEEPSTR